MQLRLGPALFLLATMVGCADFPSKSATEATDGSISATTDAGVDRTERPENDTAPRSFAQTSGSVKARSDKHEALLHVGAPQPMGAMSSKKYRVAVGQIARQP